MKDFKRRFVSGTPNHCYQRTIDGNLLFYNVADCLVLFTIICTSARRYNVVVLALCFMPDHIHGTYVTETPEDLSGFVGEYTSKYARAFNESFHRDGPLFDGPFGSAPKTTNKAIRTNLIYVYNNPVERHIVKQAEEYKWNFMAYAGNDNPFSGRIVRRKASGNLKKAVSLIDSLCDNNRPLTYKLLRKLFSKLAKPERNQLTDYIISKYSVINHQAAINFFGSYDNLLTAVHSTTGSEYDIREEYTGYRDDCYSIMSGILLETGMFCDIHDTITLPPAKKRELYRLLRIRTNATSRQIEKYLHIPPEVVKPG